MCSLHIVKTHEKITNKVYVTKYSTCIHSMHSIVVYRHTIIFIPQFNL